MIHFHVHFEDARIVDSKHSPVSLNAVTGALARNAANDECLALYWILAALCDEISLAYVLAFKACQNSRGFDDGLRIAAAVRARTERERRIELSNAMIDFLGDAGGAHSTMALSPQLTIRNASRVD